MSSRLRGRPAHMPGPTFLSYTPSGKRLVTVGQNNAIRVFQSGSDEEPVVIDNCQDANTAVVATNDFFIVGSEDCTVSKYSLKSNTFEEILAKCTLPIRDLALTPDGTWVAVASDEINVKVINTGDITKVQNLREHSKPIKHVSFDGSGTVLAASGTDGVVYFYSLSSEEPRLLKKVDGLIKNLESDVEASSKIVWHPSGGAFGAATVTRDFQVVSREDWEHQRAFKDGHTTDITAAAWSPNGALLATTSIDRKLILWDSKTQQPLKSYNTPATILKMQWHPSENILSYTNNDGELYIHTDFVPDEHLDLLQSEPQKPPLLHGSVFGNGAAQPNGALPQRKRRGSASSMLDAILGSDAESAADDDDGFIVDDDGAGYAEEFNGNGKRPNGDVPNGISKRPRPSGPTWKPRAHAPFQPGSTPWRGNRRYLCLNLVGFAWTVDQETHHTVTVEFYDRELARDFHFTDPFMYDKACLNEHGALFSCPPRPGTGGGYDDDDGEPAHIFYRPHETWTARSEWRTRLPRGESVTALALSSRYVVACTSAGYVRVFSLFGAPVRVHRQKAAPAVACAAHGDLVLTVGNGAVGADGRTQLVYSLEDVARDVVHQSNDVVALPPQGGELKSVFFSDGGDPCIFDDAGVLLVLAHWRRAGQARWVPLLDAAHVKIPGATSARGRLWPVAVAGGRFHAIVLRPGEAQPYFPRPLVGDFAFAVPLTATPVGDAAAAAARDPDGDAMDVEDGGRAAPTAESLEHGFVLHSILATLLADAVAAPLSASAMSTTETRLELGRCELEADKALLQLVAAECRAGEERGMKALELAALMRNRNGRMLEAARKVALRYGRERLAERIAELEEERLMSGERGDSELE